MCHAAHACIHVETSGSVEFTLAQLRAACVAVSAVANSSGNSSLMEHAVRFEMRLPALLCSVAGAVKLEACDLSFMLLVVEVL